MEMEPTTAFEKRVRRHVSSRDYTYLAVVQPAFRSLCREELLHAKFAVAETVDAGIEFTGRLEEGWRANLVLRTPSRIYCRAAAFKAGAREELFRKTSGIPWELWISSSVPLRIDGTAERARIQHEGVLADTFRQAVERRFHEAGLEPPSSSPPGASLRSQRVLVRAEGDRCTVSLDMSGDPLFFRGYRRESAGAPLRETLAAALLYELGWEGEGILLDPMTGSGTFAVEAALIASGVQPGAHRSFLFESWPSFRRPAWDYLHRSCEPAPGVAAQEKTNPVHCIFASDVNPSALEMAKRNGLRARTKDCVVWKVIDFFDLTAAECEAELRAEKSARKFLVFNPPYGVRIAGGDASFYERLGRHVRREFSDWKVLVLFPSSETRKAFGLTPLRTFEFRHGGLRITAGIFSELREAESP